MSGFYPGLRDLANRLLTERGQALTLTRVTQGDLDPVEGRAAETRETFQVQAAVLPATGSTVEAFDNRITDEFRSRSIRYLLMSAAGAEPKQNDEIALEGSNWRVVGVTPLNPAGTAVIYNVGVVKL
ncbi:MAG: hypothetical protein AAF556_03295 [Pseudomonadota bacterium]